METSTINHNGSTVAFTDMDITSHGNVLGSLKAATTAATKRIKAIDAEIAALQSEREQIRSYLGHASMPTVIESAKPTVTKAPREPTTRKPASAPSEDIETVIAAIEQHDAGRTSEELQGQLGWEKGRVSKAIKAAGEQIRVEGRARGARYFSQKSDDAS